MKFVLILVAYTSWIATGVISNNFGSFGPHGFPGAHRRNGLEEYPRFSQFEPFQGQNGIQFNPNQFSPNQSPDFSLNPLPFHSPSIYQQPNQYLSGAPFDDQSGINFPVSQIQDVSQPNQMIDQYPSPQLPVQSPASLPSPSFPQPSPGFPSFPQISPGNGITFPSPSQTSQGNGMTFPIQVGSQSNALFPSTSTATSGRNNGQNPSEPLMQRIIINIRNRLGPQRRLFPPFNRLVLSLVAPRLLRFQFDMMLQAIIAEVVRKVVFPLIGVITGGAGGAGRGLAPSGSGGGGEVEDEAEPIKAEPAPSVTKLAPNSFVFQSGVQGAPVVTAVPNPSSPGQLQFIITSHPNQQQQQPQQYLMQLQPQIQSSTQQTSNQPQQMTATLMQLPVNQQAVNQMSANLLQPQQQQQEQQMLPIQQQMVQIPSFGQNQVHFPQDPRNAPVQVQQVQGVPGTQANQVSVTASRPQQTTVPIQVTLQQIAPNNNKNDNRDQGEEDEEDSQQESDYETEKMDKESGTKKRMQYVDNDVPNYGNQENDLDQNQSQEQPVQDQDSVNSAFGRRNIKDLGLYPRNTEERERAKRWNTVLEDLAANYPPTNKLEAGGGAGIKSSRSNVNKA